MSDPNTLIHRFAVPLSLRKAARIAHFPEVVEIGLKLTTAADEIAAGDIGGGNPAAQGQALVERSLIEYNVLLKDGKPDPAGRKKVGLHDDSAHDAYVSFHPQTRHFINAAFAQLHKAPKGDEVADALGKCETSTL